MKSRSYHKMPRIVSAALILLFVSAFPAVSAPLFGSAGPAAESAIETTTLSVSTPGDTAIGDALIAIIAVGGKENFQGNNGIVDESGTWTLLDVDAVQSNKTTLAVFGKFATQGGSQSTIFSWSSGAESAAVVLRYTGVDDQNPTRILAGQNGSDSNPAAPSVDNPFDDTRVVRVFAADRSGVRSYTSPAGNTSRFSGASDVAGGSGNKRSVSLAIVDAVQAVGGSSGDALWSEAGGESESWRGVSFVLIPPEPPSFGINPLPPGDANPSLPLCVASGSDGSITTSGILNNYFPGTASASAGATSISIGASRSGTGVISNGDLLLVIQMQDATINSSNSVSYGDGSGAASGSLGVGQSGLYEYVVANSDLSGGGLLALKRPLGNTFNAGGNSSFQVVRVPRYDDLTLGGDLGAPVWNGSTGGVVAVDIAGTLDFDGNNIDVSGAGFRPGLSTGEDARGESQNEPAWVVTEAGVEPDFDPAYFGEKGEGIAGTPAISYGGVGYPDGDRARGAPGNAGGAGNDHNGGGAGGSNIGFGGAGGDGWSAGAVAGGYGGGAFAGYSGRLLLGGGGGAGHTNGASDDAGHGAPGGGLVIINAASVTGTGQVLANGGAAPDTLGSSGNSAGNDGAGGGGGGGSILLRTSTQPLSGISLAAAGGAGGDVITDAPHGPGGGGGGGAIYVNRAVATSIDGGTAGVFSGNGGTHGATAGSEGEVAAITSYPLPLACDLADEPTSYNGTGTAHLTNDLAGSATALTLGSLVDFETEISGNSTADADDLSDTSGVSAGNDEEGVRFRYPSEGVLEADVLVNNPGEVGAVVCGWLDTQGDGVYSAAEGRCQTTSERSDLLTFSWSGLSSSVPDTYARFRVTSGSMGVDSPTGVEFDGEVEAYAVPIQPVADYGDAPVTGGFSYGDAAHQQSSLLETLTIANVSSAWTVVTFKDLFSSPVVACTYNLLTDGNNPAVVRLRNVSSSGFEVRIQSPADVGATQSNVYCLVAEEGYHSLPGGGFFEAHRVVSTESSGVVPDLYDVATSGFSEEVTADIVGAYANPAVFGQVMSFNDPRFSVFWSNDCVDWGSPPIGAGGGRTCVGKQILEDNIVTTRVSETLGYIVVQPGSGVLDSIGYEVALGGDTILGVDNGPPFSYGLSSSFDFALATMTAVDGRNGGWAVIYGGSPFQGNALALAIDEDTIFDDERAHTNEQVSYWAFTSGDATLAPSPYLGLIPGDLEPASQSTADALGDDSNDTSSGGAGDDEDGIAFRSPAGTGDSIFADVLVNNPTSAPVTVCGWLDVPTGGVVDGVFDASDVALSGCQLAASGVSTVTFQWAGLPDGASYVTYARFRVSTEALTAADATGLAIDGEAEDYRVAFDFRPTAVTMGQVSLAALPVRQFLDGLNLTAMSRGEMLSLLRAWDEVIGKELSSASRPQIKQALMNYLDPDGDATVAVLFWDTLEERGTIGFHVERKGEGLSWQRINQQMLPGLITAPMGGEYQLADPGAESAGRYQYRLIEQEARGTTRVYGPFEVELR